MNRLSITCSIFLLCIVAMLSTSAAAAGDLTPDVNVDSRRLFDGDTDGDGVLTRATTARLSPTPVKLDTDLDGAGDVCDCAPADPGIGACDDGNVCTDDVCDPEAGCGHTNNTAPATTATSARRATPAKAGSVHRHKRHPTSALASPAPALSGRMVASLAGAEKAVARSRAPTGAPTTTPRSARATPTPVLCGRTAVSSAGAATVTSRSRSNGSTDGYRAVTAGYNYTCALRADGRLVCWGLDDYGQVSGPGGSADIYTAVSGAPRPYLRR